MVELKLDIPADFYREEVRCGFTVTEERKKVWAVNLDLMSELFRVCKKHDIKAFATDGTMLGAVRHKGFIPWDDDVDVSMLRADYERLCEIAPAEFQHPYFFQTEYTDPGSLRGHAQLRNSLTTGILRGELGKYKFNQGIFVDIFPMDAVVDDEALFRAQEKKADRYKNLAKRLGRLSTRYKRGGGVKGAVKAAVYPVTNRVIRSFRLEERAYAKFEKACQMYNDTDTAYIQDLSFHFRKQSPRRLRSHYVETIDVPFEFITVPITAAYDAALTEDYGDYMEFVPGASAHGDTFFDPDRPYTEYI